MRTGPHLRQPNETTGVSSVMSLRAAVYYYKKQKFRTVTTLRLLGWLQIVRYNANRVFPRPQITRWSLEPIVKDPLRTRFLAK